MKSNKTILRTRTLLIALGMFCFQMTDVALSQSADKDLKQIALDSLVAKTSEQSATPASALVNAVTQQELQEAALAGATEPKIKEALQFILMAELGAGNESMRGAGSAMLGVHVRKADETLRSQLNITGQFGLVVEHVTAGSAAEEAKLLAHDLLHKLDGQVLVNVEQFQALIDAKKPGDEVKLEYFRMGESEKQTIALSERKLAPANATLDSLQNYHQQLLFPQPANQGGEYHSTTPHKIAAQVLNCQTCHSSIDTQATSALDAIRFMDYRVVPTTLKAKKPEPANDR